MAQIIQITSEALQATIRRLLPSQKGFGEDLQASNVITPIIDLTPSAEGSETRVDLQSAIAFGSQTAFQVNNATATVVNTPGFYRIFGVSSCIGANGNARFEFSDGLSTKTIWGMGFPTGGTTAAMSVEFDFTVFLTAGDTLSAVSTNGLSLMTGSSRQIATVTGELVNPVGFTPQ